jgi:hypothetical protein
MTYQFLQSGLWPIAELVKTFLRDNRGVTSIRAEESIHPRVSLRPTLSGKIPGGIVCAEVSETLFPDQLNAFVSDCLAHGLPVQIFAACPASPSGKIDEVAIRRASSLGVGCMLVANKEVEVIREPLDLSLFVDDSKTKSFPGKYRRSVAEAFMTYRGGNPVKGLATLCDTIELILRKVAKRAKATGAILPTNRLDLEKGPLHDVIEVMTSRQVLDRVLLARCLAMTEYRNESSHAPKNMSALIRRNQRLRNNFYTALQLLEDLLSSIRGMRV